MHCTKSEYKLLDSKRTRDHETIIFMLSTNDCLPHVQHAGEQNINGHIHKHLFMREVNLGIYFLQKMTKSNYGTFDDPWRFCVCNKNSLSSMHFVVRMELTISHVRMHVFVIVSVGGSNLCFLCMNLFF